MKRVKGVTITPFYGAIQDKDEAYYMQFNLVVCGLDSVEARRWINATLVNMVDMENPESLKPLIDGGTEGNKLRAMLIQISIFGCNKTCSAEELTRMREMLLGFKGQARVILPTISSCYECSLDMLTPRTTVPLCTLASIPRQPAHCIEWASIIQWPKEMGGMFLDYIHNIFVVLHRD